MSKSDPSKSKRYIRPRTQAKEGTYERWGARAGCQMRSECGDWMEALYEQASSAVVRWCARTARCQRTQAASRHGRYSHAHLPTSHQLDGPRALAQRSGLSPGLNFPHFCLSVDKGFHTAFKAKAKARVWRQRPNSRHHSPRASGPWTIWSFCRQENTAQYTLG